MTNIENNEDLSLIETAQAKIKYKWGYMVFLVIILGLTHLLDAYATQAPAWYKTSMIKEFFVINSDQDLRDAASFITALTFFAFLLTILGVFFKGLMDKVGRKPIFIISAAGMTLGVIIMIIASNFGFYFVGTTILMFFFSQDMQYQFIQEETPSKFRVQAFSYAKMLGLMGFLLIPWIRGRNTVVIAGEEIVNWRPILYPPAIIGIVVVIGSLFFLKETRAFRILKEERLVNPDAFKEEKFTLKSAFQDMRKLPTWKQVKWLLIARLVMLPFNALNISYSELFMEQAGIGEFDKNTIITMSIIFNGVAYFLQGIFADRVGRKPAIIINSLFVIVLIPVEYFVMLNHNLVLAGMIQGFRIGAFWNMMDTSRFMLIENVPTRIRGWSQSISNLFGFIVIVPTFILIVVLIKVFTYVQILLMIVGIPICITIFFIGIFKLKETKDVDLTKI